MGAAEWMVTPRVSQRVGASCFSLAGERSGYGHTTGVDAAATGRESGSEPDGTHQ